MQMPPWAPSDSCGSGCSFCIELVSNHSEHSRKNTTDPLCILDMQHNFSSEAEYFVGDKKSARMDYCRSKIVNRRFQSQISNSHTTWYVRIAEGCIQTLVLTHTLQMETFRGETKLCCIKSVSEQQRAASVASLRKMTGYIFGRPFL